MPELCKRWRLNIRPITHLHIASGEWLDPTQYVISANNFYVLNQPRLVSRLNAKNPARLQEMLKLSHDRIAAFLSDSFDPSQADTWTQRHTVEESYQKQYLRDLGNPEAQQLVAAFISNPLTGNPYIPGSSIKGAIRTALVDWRAKDPAARIRRVNGKINDWNLEPILFRYLNERGRPNITDDPFKWLKVADCEFSMQSLGLRKVEVRKKNKAMEASRAHPGDELSYLCQVLLKDSEGLSTVISADARWLKMYSMQKLAECCNNYFERKLKEEDYFYLPEKKKTHDNFKAWAKAMKANQFMLRLGKGTGALHKSVNDPKYQTRSLAGGLPLGICCCSLEELP